MARIRIMFNTGKIVEYDTEAVIDLSKMANHYPMVITDPRDGGQIWVNLNEVLVIEKAGEPNDR